MKGDRWGGQRSSCAARLLWRDIEENVSGGTRGAAHSKGLDCGRTARLLSGGPRLSAGWYADPFSPRLHTWSRSRGYLISEAYWASSHCTMHESRAPATHLSPG